MKNTRLEQEAMATVKEWVDQGTTIEGLRQARREGNWPSAADMDFGREQGFAPREWEDALVEALAEAEDD